VTPFIIQHDHNDLFLGLWTPGVQEWVARDRAMQFPTQDWALDAITTLLNGKGRAVPL
jgi:hypothetical protein